MWLQLAPARLPVPAVGCRQFAGRAVPSLIERFRRIVIFHQLGIDKHEICVTLSAKILDMWEEFNLRLPSEVIAKQKIR